MNRSVGVTVVAALELLGSAFTTLMGLLIVASAFLVPFPVQHDAPVPTSALKAILGLVSLFYLAAAIWGGASGVGILRLKNWARISTIVFSVILILISVFSGLMILVMPFPTAGGANPEIAAAVKWVMALFWLFLCGIGVWWIVFFTRANVKAQFVPPEPVAFAPTGSLAAPLQQIPASATSRTERPLSLTVIAWLLLIGCAFFPISGAMQAPGFLVTRVLTGWTAVVYMALAGVVQLYVGIGLLRYQPLARTIGVWYYMAMMANLACFNFIPGSRTRLAALMEAQQKAFPWLAWMQTQPEFHIDPMPYMYFGAVIGFLTMGTLIYFLVTRKAAFESAACTRSAQVRA